MTIRDMQNEILRLKKQNDILILAHSYQRREVVEVADFTGDSYALACRVANSAQKNVLMCGVRFMAETINILSPEKHVFLANENAGCPMAEQLETEELAALKARYPHAAVAAYINTTAALKTMADVCVTSSSAVKILSQIPEKEILFVPDINLGQFVEKSLPEKKFYFVHGGCPTHLRAGERDVEEARRVHPNALLLAHPECRPCVSAAADYVGSTSGIMDYAKNSVEKEFIIGTDNSIVEHLQYECPEKRFYPLSKDFECHNMRLTTLFDVYAACLGERSELVLDEKIRLAAKRSIDRMIALGG